MSTKQDSKTLIIAITSVTILLIIGGFLFFSLKYDDSNEPKETELIQQAPQMSAWIADWVWESGLEDLKKIADRLDSLQVFAAYFDEKDGLYFTKDLHRALPDILKVAKENSLNSLYLTLVNDIMYAEGTEVQKDSALITRLMATEESREEHIKDILFAMNTYGFNGVDIDYEKINDSDWENVCAFYLELYERLKPLGKKMRIVLEPRAPIERLILPEGPSYIMMAYNLFGNHSGPGPKADHEFIEKLAKRMEKLPGNPVIAFSAGGFDWSSDNGKVTSLTEKQAEKLLLDTKATSKRDPKSGGVYFEYRDKDNIEHTVWYADKETFSQWIRTASKAGIHNIALWRLGGLGKATLDSL
ncbi:glycosyl hydrolase family 18 protein [Cohnella abietis]|nr:glycosyl hydrolase family 18 protein [Cohnella abietis]